jgi:hypothetical protein
MSKRSRPDVRDVATTIMERAPKGHVVVLSDPPTLEQRLHLMAARIDGRPMMILTIGAEPDAAKTASRPAPEH